MAFDLVFDLELGIGTDLRWDLREGGILHVYGGVARFYLFFLKSSSYVSRKKKNERMYSSGDDKILIRSVDDYDIIFVFILVSVAVFPSASA